MFCSPINASNDWSTFEARDIYPIAEKCNCVFPFIYQNNVYNDCTTDGYNGNIPWCSLTTEYQGLFTYCYDFWNSTLKCLPSFKVYGRTFTKCDYLTSNTKYKQCKTNNSDVPYRYCIEDHIVKTLKPLYHLNACHPAYKKLYSFHSMW
ncbi:unnamed protein product [Rotaria sp. Silwood2]|nr:unnamed protein product [Rotaria sp. Silwood2]CAF2835037.1 unnamed protein product [Rotaria sp. Silwood2]CAF3198635.1 unnamed protein product [Rotaria sp. Silwood2]CAF3328331.1 unnamed protein product [Rotaria sp. Silwood2]CAF4118084.1 unnamed protein product [Rotaria sp. Silwood2]